MKEKGKEVANLIFKIQKLRKNIHFDIQKFFICMAVFSPKIHPAA